MKRTSTTKTISPLKKRNWNYKESRKEVIFCSKQKKKGQALLFLQRNGNRTDSFFYSIVRETNIFLTELLSTLSDIQISDI